MTSAVVLICCYPATVLLSAPVASHTASFDAFINNAQDKFSLKIVGSISSIITGNVVVVGNQSSDGYTCCYLIKAAIIIVKAIILLRAVYVEQGTERTSE